MTADTLTFKTTEALLDNILPRLITSQDLLAQNWQMETNEYETEARYSTKIPPYDIIVRFNPEKDLTWSAQVNSWPLAHWVHAYTQAELIQKLVTILRAHEFGSLINWDRYNYSKLITRAKVRNPEPPRLKQFPTFPDPTLLAQQPT